MTFTRPIVAALALSAVTIMPSQGWSQTPQLLGNLQVKSGKVFANARVISVEPDGLRLSHDAGVSKIAFTDLPKSLAQQFPHDPDAAAEFAANAEVAHREAIRLGEEERLRAEYGERCRRAGLPPGFVIPAEGPITVDQVKGQWLLDNVANMPTFGEPDRNFREAAIENRKALILSGALDRDAEKISLRRNLDWYLHHGETAKADVARQRLADMQTEESKQAELAVLNRLADSVSQLAAASTYRSDVIAELTRFRCELERCYPSYGPFNQHS
ncbi:MAG TPA: hypothetical protein VLE43_07830, partial [Candidatus Saccharimonadia bacterium]|nr:hypothetical protein [Candidatus Saccharimonadia bacterium]